MFKETSKNLLKYKDLIILKLAAVIILLLFVLTISIGVDIINKIKEGRYIGQDVTPVNTISVTGASQVYAKPDLALANFSVVNEAKTVAEALSENTSKMNAVIAFIKNQGVQDKDLKTANFNISPRYEWRKATEMFPSGERVMTGYEVTQSLQVKIRDLSKIGAIIQGAADNGANQVDNLQFTIDQQDELKKQARQDAIDQAKSKAKELASQLGVNLGKITNFSESGYFPAPIYYGMEKAVGIGGSTPQIETGENKIEASVTITYEIR